MRREAVAMNAPAKDALVLFMPSGRRGRFPLGTPVLDAARSLGVYIESVCGGRGICGRCQIQVAEGEFAKHGITSSQRPSLGVLGDRGALRLASAASSASSAASPARRPSRATSSSTCRRTCRSTARSCASAPRRGRSSAIRRRSSATSRSTSRTCTSRSATPTGFSGRSPSSGGCERLRIDFRLLPMVQKILREGEWKVTAAVHHDAGRSGGHRALAGAEEFRLRHRGRHRVDDHRLPPLLSPLRADARLGRRAEPADPLRRGPDEPRLLRDDESRRRGGADQGGARGDRRADRKGLRGGRRSPPTRSSRRCSSATRSCITSSSASTRRNSAARPSRLRSPRR